MTFSKICRLTADYIDNHPDEYSYSAIRVPDCGSPGCVIGLAGMIRGISIGEHVGSSCEEILGINDFELYEKMSKVPISISAGDWSGTDNVSKCLRHIADIADISDGRLSNDNNPALTISGMRGVIIEEEDISDIADISEEEAVAAKATIRAALKTVIGEEDIADISEEEAIAKAEAKDARAVEIAAYAVEKVAVIAEKAEKEAAKVTIRAALKTRLIATSEAEAAAEEARAAAERYTKMIVARLKLSLRN
ncbi:MAG: hypothetical protein V3R78_12545 [Thermodesulfobacteriota bacterium]